MNSSAITALITGICVVIAAIVAGIYAVRVARVQRTPEHLPQAPVPITITVSSSDTEQALPDSTHWRSSPVADGKSKSEAADNSRFDVSQTTIASSAAAPGKPQSESPAEVNPATRVLPLVPFHRSYEGLSGDELDVEFLTDIQFTIKDGDKFIFDDDSGMAE